MLILPYKLGISIPRLPLVTLVISALCILVYLLVVANERSIQNHALKICAEHAARWSYGAAGTAIRIDQKMEPCEAALSRVHISVDPEHTLHDITRDLVDHGDRWPALRLMELYKIFRVEAETALGNALRHHTWRLDLIGLLTSPVTHRDFTHLFYNLVFFVFFAVAVETMLGWKRFLGLVLLLKFTGGTIHSFYALVTGDERLAAGLSGVAFGVLGFFVYLLPQMKIRCLAWAGRSVGQVWLPAWVIPVTLVWWNTYFGLIAGSDVTLGLISHLGSFLLGIVFGLLCFRPDRQRLLAEEGIGHQMERSEYQQQMSWLPSSGYGLTIAVAVAGGLLCLAFTPYSSTVRATLYTLPALTLIYYARLFNFSKTGTQAGR